MTACAQCTRVSQLIMLQGCSPCCLPWITSAGDNLVNVIARATFVKCWKSLFHNTVSVDGSVRIRKLWQPRFCAVGYSCYEWLSDWNKAAQGSSETSKNWSKVVLDRVNSGQSHWQWVMTCFTLNRWCINDIQLWDFVISFCVTCVQHHIDFLCCSMWTVNFACYHSDDLNDSNGSTVSGNHKFLVSSVDEL